MRKLFISYARDSRRDIDQLVEHLGMLGYETWFDSSLRGGQDWWAEILRRIADCDVFIAVISRNALDSTACRHEFEWADALGKPVLPVAVEPITTALPRRFATRQIVDYSDPGHRDRAAVILSGGLATLPPVPPLPQPLPDPPPTPLSYLTDLTDLIAEPTVLSQQQQRDILNQLEPALGSVDPQERRSAHDILERFSHRRDLYADVDRTVARLRTLPDQPDPVNPDDVPQSDPGPDPAPKAETPPRDPAIPPAPAAPTDPPGPSPARQSLLQRLSRRTKIAALAAGVLIVVTVVVAAVILGRQSSPQPPAPTSTVAAPPVPPVAVAALPALLLSPAEISTAMGTTAMTVDNSYTTLSDDSAHVSDKACLASLAFAADVSAYTGTGWTTGNGQFFLDTGTTVATTNHAAFQFVVLFSSAYDAAAFFTRSPPNWLTCSTTGSYIYTFPGQTDGRWKVGPISNANGTLSSSDTLEDGGGWVCQRVLTVVNNVAIDIRTCSYNATDPAAVNIAHQIAAKVPT